MGCERLKELIGVGWVHAGQIVMSGPRAGGGPKRTKAFTLVGGVLRPLS